MAPAGADDANHEELQDGHFVNRLQLAGCPKTVQRNAALVRDGLGLPVVSDAQLYGGREEPAARLGEIERRGFPVRRRMYS